MTGITSFAIATSAAKESSLDSHGIDLCGEGGGGTATTTGANEKISSINEKKCSRHTGRCSLRLFTDLSVKRVLRETRQNVFAREDHS